LKSVKGRAAPDRALLIQCSIKWWNSEPGYLLALEGALQFNGIVVSEGARLKAVNWRGNSSELFHQNLDVEGEIVVPLTMEAIRFIEDRRGAGDVNLCLDLTAKWIRAPGAVGKPAGAGTASQPVGGDLRWGSCGNEESKLVAHSDWLRLLTEMGWQEIELFEVTARPLRADANLKIALERLTSAQKCLRDGEYADALANCRKAFESAAKFEGNGDVKEGFQSLLNRVFPGEAEKLKLFDAAIRALSDVAHTLGRHEQAPALQVSREEAEFVFASTVSLFAMIGRRLNSDKVHSR